jgi:hypothetical protein
VVDEVAPGFAVEGLGGHVETVGPGDRAGFGVDLDARDAVGVAEGLEDAAPLAFAEVDLAYWSWKVSRSRYGPMTSTAVMSTSCPMAFMSGERVDRLDAVVLAGPVPSWR